MFRHHRCLRLPTDNRTNQINVFVHQRYDNTDYDPIPFGANGERILKLLVMLKIVSPLNGLTLHNA